MCAFRWFVKQKIFSEKMLHSRGVVHRAGRDFRSASWVEGPKARRALRHPMVGGDVTIAYERFINLASTGQRGLSYKGA
jgi:hypothetical protein